LAPHMGQRTDNIWPSVSFSGFTAILFNIANRRDGQSCIWDFNQLRNGNLTGADQCPWSFRQGRDAIVVARQQHYVQIPDVQIPGCGDFTAHHDRPA
jgi:hypothetical protein